MRLSESCFGVYLFQQFVLKFIYNSAFPHMISSYILPWLSFVIAIIISLGFTIVIRKSNVGRKLV